MQQSNRLIILVIVGFLVGIAVLTQCRLSSPTETVKQTSLPARNSVIGDNSTEKVQVTQTEHITSASLPSTLQSPAFTLTPELAPTPVPTLPAGIPILTAEGPRAATNLRAGAECDLDQPWKGIVNLNWTIASLPGSEQRVIMTVYRDGFEVGRFDASDSLASDQSGMMWDRLSPGIIHFWMVLTRHEDGWVPSEQSSFEAPVCAVDYVPTPTP